MTTAESITADTRYIVTEIERRTVAVQGIHGTTWQTTVISVRDWLKGKYAGHSDKITMCYSSTTPIIGEYFGQMVGHSEDSI